jgi:hypothetical protein
MLSQTQIMDNPMNEKDFEAPVRGHLLGKPLCEVREEFGEPFGSYEYRGRNICVFDNGNGVITCEIDGGIVTAINSLRERRSTVRIVPPNPMKAFVRCGSSRTVASIIDISRISVAMHVESGALFPNEGDFVTFCTSLRPRSRQLSFINLAGHVHTVDPDQMKIVIIFHDPHGTHSYNILADYIGTHLALTAIGIKKEFPPFLTIAGKEHFSPDITVTKSDLCSMCQEGACGGAHGWLNPKKMPAHLGISGGCPQHP